MADEPRFRPKDIDKDFKPLAVDLAAFDAHFGEAMEAGMKELAEAPKRFKDGEGVEHGHDRDVIFDD